MKESNNEAINQEPPVSRWTRQTPLQKLIKGPNQAFFYFNELPEPLSPIELEIGDLKMKWTNGFWKSVQDAEKEAISLLTPEELKKIEEENEDLENQIEFLIDLNAKYELEKTKLREKVQSLEEQIKGFPGVMDDDDF